MGEYTEVRLDFLVLPDKRFWFSKTYALNGKNRENFGCFCDKCEGNFTDFQKNSFDMSEDFLFDKGLLERLDFHQVKGIFNPPVTASNPGDHLMVRPLSIHDFDKGFMQLLGQLTDTGVPTRQQFLEKFKFMKGCPNTYFVTVIEDLQTNCIVGAATLLVEHKFIHGCGKRGHLEDVVVNNAYRGKQLGKLIVVTVTLLARHLGCYKMTLECKDKLIPFYTSLGFKLEPGNSNSMVQRFKISDS